MLAHADATFGFPEVRRGVLPGVVSVAAGQRLSPEVCKQLMRTGDRIDAAAMKRVGLADMVGSSAELAMEAQRLRQILDSRGAEASVEQTKVGSEVWCERLLPASMSFDQQRGLAELTFDAYDAVRILIYIGPRIDRNSYITE